MLLERLLGDVLKLVSIVLERPAEIVVKVIVVLVLEVAGKPARLALDLAGVAEVDEQAEWLVVAHDIATIDLGLELDLGHDVLVVIEHLAGVERPGVVADDLEARLQVPILDRGLDHIEPGEKRVGELAHVPLARLARDRLDRLADQFGLTEVGERFLGDVLRVAGADRGGIPVIEDVGLLVVSARCPARSRRRAWRPAGTRRTPAGAWARTRPSARSPGGSCSRRA